MTIPEPTEADMLRNAELDYRLLPDDTTLSCEGRRLWIRLREHERKRAESAERERYEARKCLIEMSVESGTHQGNLAITERERDELRQRLATIAEEVEKQWKAHQDDADYSGNVRIALIPIREALTICGTRTEGK